jgi:hypothetical protein
MARLVVERLVVLELIAVVMVLGVARLVGGVMALAARHLAIPKAAVEVVEDITAAVVELIKALTGVLVVAAALAIQGV